MSNSAQRDVERMLAANVRFADIETYIEDRIDLSANAKGGVVAARVDGDRSTGPATGRPGASRGYRVRRGKIEHSNECVPLSLRPCNAHRRSTVDNDRQVQRSRPEVDGAGTRPRSRSWLGHR
jgi:hypothetical protein